MNAVAVVTVAGVVDSSHSRGPGILAAPDRGHGPSRRNLIRHEIKPLSPMVSRLISHRYAGPERPLRDECHGSNTPP
jgi:hypothetical protein